MVLNVLLLGTDFSYVYVKKLLHGLGLWRRWDSSCAAIIILEHCWI